MRRLALLVLLAGCDSTPVPQVREPPVALRLVEAPKAADGPVIGWPPPAWRAPAIGCASGSRVIGWAVEPRIVRTDPERQSYVVETAGQIAVVDRGSGRVSFLPPRAEEPAQLEGTREVVFLDKDQRGRSAWISAIDPATGVQRRMLADQLAGAREQSSLRRTSGGPELLILGEQLWALHAGEQTPVALSGAPDALRVSMDGFTAAIVVDGRLQLRDLRGMTTMDAMRCERIEDWNLEAGVVVCEAPDEKLVLWAGREIELGSSDPRSLHLRDDGTGLNAKFADGRVVVWTSSAGLVELGAGATSVVLAPDRDVVLLTRGEPGAQVLYLRDLLTGVEQPLISGYFVGGSFSAGSRVVSLQARGEDGPTSLSVWDPDRNLSLPIPHERYSEYVAARVIAQRGLIHVNWDDAMGLFDVATGAEAFTTSRSSVSEEGSYERWDPGETTLVLPDGYAAYAGIDPGPLAAYRPADGELVELAEWAWFECFSGGRVVFRKADERRQEARQLVSWDAATTHEQVLSAHARDPDCHPEAGTVIFREEDEHLAWADLATGHVLRLDVPVTGYEVTDTEVIYTTADALCAIPRPDR